MFLFLWQILAYENFFYFRLPCILKLFQVIEFVHIVLGQEMRNHMQEH